MQYNQGKIATRIKTERKAAKLSKVKLADRLHVNRNTITVWEQQDENGRIPPLDDLLNMCNAFDCDLGYLLGEYDCKTRVATDIQAKIGLSEKAIQKLINNLEDEKISHEALSQMIEHAEFNNFLGDLTEYCKLSALEFKTDKIIDEKIQELQEIIPPGVVLLKSGEAVSYYLDWAIFLLKVIAQDMRIPRGRDIWQILKDAQETPTA